ncbi:MAG: TIGR04076 family protein [Clostridia bacterium]|nr:TIGR04076 family protein [Clostridia bacterium]
MKNVKITVMRMACHKDLIEKYENPIEHACEMTLGQEFISKEAKKPDGFCDSAWDSVSPFVFALSHDAEDFYGGWMKNKKSAMISCNDGFRPVSFLVEAIEKDAE